MDTVFRTKAGKASKQQDKIKGLPRQAKAKAAARENKVKWRRGPFKGNHDKA